MRYRRRPRFAAAHPATRSFFTPRCTSLHTILCNPRNPENIFRAFSASVHRMCVGARVYARVTAINILMEKIEDILKSGLTLTGCKLASDSMSALVAPLGLSILVILWSLGRTRKTQIFNLISRDWTTVSHNCTFLIQDGYVTEEVVTHKEKYLSLTTKGTEVVNRFIMEASKKADALTSLMPDPHIAETRSAVHTA